MRSHSNLALLPILALLAPAGVVSQGPPSPAKLVISSEPAGAVIVINGQRMQQHTDATFYVSSGTYTVSVASPTLSCSSPIGETLPSQPGAVRVKVSSGQTAAIMCK